MVNGQYDHSSSHHLFYLKTPKDTVYVHPDLSNTTFVLTKLNQNDYAMVDSPISLTTVSPIPINNDSTSEAGILTYTYVLDVESDVSFYG